MKRRLTVSLLWLTKIPVAAWRTGRCDDVLPSDIWQAPGLAELKAGAAAAEKARLLVGAKTQRESDYIAAIETFFRDANQLDHRTRALAYEKANVQRSRKSSLNARASTFLSVIGTPSGALDCSPHAQWRKPRTPSSPSWDRS